MQPMERRIALSIATAAAVAITAGGAAFAANAGLLGTDKADPVGELSAANVVELVPTTTSTAPTPEIVVIDEFITVPGAASPGRSANGGTSALPQGGAGQAAPTGGVASVDGTSGAAVAPLPTTPGTAPTTDPGAAPGPGWEWDDDDQRWELDDDDDDYDDDDYDYDYDDDDEDEDDDDD